jgi:hypothetical protein
MQSLGNPSNPGSGSTPRRGISLKMGTIGMTLMLFVFLVAVVFAANQNDVVGWLVVIVSLGWLLIFAFVVFSIRGAAKRASAKLATAQAQFDQAYGRAPASADAGGKRGKGGTTLVNEGGRADAIRDQKLDHSFKIVQVQARVVRDNLGKDQDTVDRAIETIEITAHNARGMLKKDDGGEPVSGTVVG